MRSRYLLVSLGCAALLTPVRSEEAAPPPAISTPPAFALIDAVNHAPSINATRARAEAARERVAASGRFPDPQLEGMLSQRRTPSEDMPMWEVTLRQPLPKAGERAADRDRAAAAAVMALADYAVMAGEMTADVAMALADADAADERATLVARQLTRTEQLLTALDARVATGASRLAERLSLQTRLASLRLMRDQENRMAEDSRSEVRGLLGLPPSAPLPSYAGPAFSEIEPETVPLVRLSVARADEARAMARMARASARPMTAVGLRFEREQERMGNNDTIGISFMTELPFRGRGYARAEERATRAEEAAAHAEANSTRHRVAAALARVARAERLAAATRKFATDTAARLDAEYDALARSNDTSVTLALDILDRLTEARLQVIEAEASVRSARAELWRYAPASTFTP
jgi:cobalt-zinc-cadmium efflux system outer membrane protein